MRVFDVRQRTADESLNSSLNQINTTLNNKVDINQLNSSVNQIITSNLGDIQNNTGESYSECR
jgi:hypothetical protein